MSFFDRSVRWVVTCEHGGHKIPHDFKYLFKKHQEVLLTHRGEDIGVKSAFSQFKSIADFWIINQVSRLLIEFNRSPYHPKLFSEYSKHISENEKNILLNHYYLPYRNRIEKSIIEFLEEGSLVIHLSIHSFTPVLNIEVRKADIGLLYDSRINKERLFCQTWKQNFQNELSGYKIRMNYPYLGKADGLVTALRKKFGKDYLGIEVELNQKLEQEFVPISKIMTSSLQIFSQPHN